MLAVPSLFGRWETSHEHIRRQFLVTLKLETVWKFSVCQFYPCWLYGHADIDLRKLAKIFSHEIRKKFQCTFRKKTDQELPQDTWYFFSEKNARSVPLYAKKSFSRGWVIFLFKVQIIVLLLFNSMVLLILIGSNEIWRFRSFRSWNLAVELVNVAIFSSVFHHCFIDDSSMFHLWIIDI